MGLSVLIVDDSLTICEVLHAMLKEYGVDQVNYCHSGEDALLRLERDPAAYDALFIDLHMEGMDGLELMHRLHDLRYRGGVVVMSALEKKVLDFTLEVISNYNLRVLGSAEKPLDKSLVAFMVKRINSYFPVLSRNEKLLKRREVFNAIKENRVVPYFQPKLSSVGNRLIGIECLVRLNLETGIVAPNAFLPVAERFELIEALTDATLDIALPQYRRFCEENAVQCSLAINLSPLQLYNDLLPDTLNEYLSKHHINITQLVLEITENHAIRDERQLKNLNRLRIHGFELSLDDFGAGYTNLRQLKTLPFNEIKLDAQLVQGIHSDKVLRVIVESIRSVTSEMKLKLIAEGVSDSRDLVAMNEIGADGYQGYLFCRPKAIDELSRWYKAWLSSVQSSSSGFSVS